VTRATALIGACVAGTVINEHSARLIPKARSMVAILVAVAAVLGGAACRHSGSEPARGPADVLLITVDTLRADHMSLYGYERPTTPHLDRWFGDGAIYERAYSTEANTSPSLVSVLSGLLPQDHGVRLLYQLLPTATRVLPELLPDRYETAAIVSNMVLTDEAIGLADRFDFYDDFVDERESSRAVYERNAARTTDAALRWLAARAESERPVFLWVHYIDPHGPYRPPTDWPRSFTHDVARTIDIDRVPLYQRERGVTDGLTYVDRYDEEIAYTDAEVGRLLDRFAVLRSIDDTLVVFTADHGESMMEHERWFTHGYHVYDEIVRVPLMLRGPGMERGRRTEPASGIDIAPTILRFLGETPPPTMPPVDLRDGMGLTPTRPIFAEATWGGKKQWRAAVTRDEKWMTQVWAPSRATMQQRRYDLVGDPGELSAQAWDPDAPAPRQLVELSRTDPDPAGRPAEYAKGLLLTAPKVAPRVSAEARERLKSLGYVE